MYWTLNPVDSSGGEHEHEAPERDADRTHGAAEPIIHTSAVVMATWQASGSGFRFIFGLQVTLWQIMQAHMGTCLWVLWAPTVYQWGLGHLGVGLCRYRNMQIPQYGTYIQRSIFMPPLTHLAQVSLGSRRAWGLQLSTLKPIHPKLKAFTTA